jgi:hypothetical protein
MNSLKLNAAVTLFLFFMTGCKPIILLINGVKKPRIENEKSLRRNAFKHGMDTTNIVTVDSKFFIEKYIQDGFPDASIFNAKGEYIEYRQTDSSCNAGLFRFIPDLHRDSTYALTGRLKMQEEIPKYRDMKGKPFTLNDKADFYVFVTWTSWIGRLNKDHVKVWEDLAKKNTQSVIKVIKVNLDIQEHWDKNERDAIMKRLSRKK